MNQAQYNSQKCLITFGMTEVMCTGINLMIIALAKISTIIIG